jgi:hypothetical protein
VKRPLLILLLLALPAQDWARTKLEKSPRHQEWVKVKSGARVTATVPKATA